MFFQLLTIGFSFLLLFIFIFTAAHENPLLCINMLFKKIKQSLYKNDGAARANKKGKESLK